MPIAPYKVSNSFFKLYLTVISITTSSVHSIKFCDLMFDPYIYIYKKKNVVALVHAIFQ